MLIQGVRGISATFLAKFSELMTNKQTQSHFYNISDRPIYLSKSVHR